MAEVVTVRAAAQMLGVHENTIRNWIASGELPYEERGAFRLPLWVGVQARLHIARFAATEDMVNVLLALADTAENEARQLRRAADLIRGDDPRTGT
jgi:excisionase family DNA binding protein